MLFAQWSMCLGNLQVMDIQVGLGVNDGKFKQTKL